MECGRVWQPTKLTHVVEALTNSTKPLHIATDQGDAIMKAVGNPEGLESLAFELVGTELACWFGLKTPDFAILNLLGIPKTWNPNFEIEDGYAFLSRYIQAATYDGHGTLLKKLANPDDLARLVVFDTWIRNSDRYPPDTYSAEIQPNLDNLMFRRSRRDKALRYDLIVFDHTHAFSSSGFEGLHDRQLISDDEVYGFFPPFKQYMSLRAIKSATDQLRKIDASDVKTLLDAVPSGWGVTIELKRKWSDFIYERAQFVAETIEAKIVYQLELWKGANDVG